MSYKCLHCGDAKTSSAIGYCEKCKSTLKNASCKGCCSEYVFFPEHESYDQIKDGESSFFCNRCLDKASCILCDTRKGTILLCDTCGVLGAHCLKCANYRTAPTGPWYCCEQCKKREPKLSTRKRGERNTEDEEQGQQQEQLKKLKAKAEMCDIFVAHKNAWKEMNRVKTEHRKLLEDFESVKREEQALREELGKVTILDAAVQQIDLTQKASHYVSLVKRIEHYPQVIETHAKMMVEPKVALQEKLEKELCEKEASIYTTNK